MKAFPIDVNFFNFLESLLFMSLHEAQYRLNKRYSGHNLRVKINKHGEVRIYNGAGMLIASMRGKEK